MPIISWQEVGMWENIEMRETYTSLSRVVREQGKDFWFFTNKKVEKKSTCIQPKTPESGCRWRNHSNCSLSDQESRDWVRGKMPVLILFKYWCNIVPLGQFISSHLCLSCTRALNRLTARRTLKDIWLVISTHSDPPSILCFHSRYFACWTHFTFLVWRGSAFHLEVI